MMAYNSLNLDDYFVLIETKKCRTLQEQAVQHDFNGLDTRILEMFKKTNRAMYARTVYRRLLQEFNAEGKEVKFSAYSIGRALSFLYHTGRIERIKKNEFLYFIENRR